MGGQRIYRRTWTDESNISGVTGVIFVAALSEYDQCLSEAKRTNRMVEALNLFQFVSNHKAFRDTSIILFLNKKDVFAEKIMYSDIATDGSPWSDYTGPKNDYESGVQYFMNKFKERSNFEESFVHVTCACDTKNMEFVLDATRKILLNATLAKIGLDM